MARRTYNVEIIGCGLALLYAISCLIFVQYLNIPEFKLRMTVYVILFGALFIGSVAVIRLNEWGRKLLLILNAAMFVCLTIRYIPQIGLVPIAYLFMNVIVFLYFSQKEIKWQFYAARHRAWNKSILLVDDEEVVVRTLRPILLSYGYSVLTASTGEDGLQIAEKQKPDLIFLDVILPGIKGRDVCQRLKNNAKTRDIPVVFLTAKDSPEDIQAEKEVGAQAHLTKPVSPKQLIETVENILVSKKSSAK